LVWFPLGELRGKRGETETSWRQQSSERITRSSHI
jgi:hypothetical protein